ncbi:hypothetical protein TVAG_305740 [Trichomonas vaginalis G3]|uniref:Molybdate-anion transporter n=1 Tax=Trichomonas vaginalis (strain ATCC PRA-98 / G3) TaxID=412133 RepID=A2DN66_TRIV3|nr:SAM (S-adenosyl methionine) transporter family [Trichomonas vaginalis G3]EAY18054.1 hypothetical protein TVAG_305740 [Trichomonas vaginalis G3]KAI5492319.1 SAM (S-adenosyl methionine) transporter family [Trichomonas vaginalis G3]|eukprot:XP_001579040.1 hypothetical protein [Trichomonas vaginalis G3]
MLATFVLATSMIRMIGSQGSKNKNFRKVQLLYYTAYFAIIIPDSIAAVYFNKFWALRGFQKQVINSLNLVIQFASIFSSIVCGPSLDKLGNTVVIYSSIIAKLFSLIIFIFTTSADFAFIGRFLWGISLIFSKISFDHWLVELTMIYEFSPIDHSILIERRSLINLLIDMTITKIVDSSAQKLGVLNLMKYILFADFMLFVPLYFVVNSTNSKSAPKAEVSKEIQKDSQKIDARSIVTAFVDTIYCMATNLFKQLLSTNFINQNLPFSMIMATYTVSLAIGNSATMIVLSYLSNTTILYIILILFAVASTFGFIFADNDFFAFLTVIALGFLDGLAVPIMVSARSEAFPSSYRGRFLSGIRASGAILSVIVTYIMKYTTESSYLLFNAIMFVLCIISYRYQDRVFTFCKYFFKMFQNTPKKSD